MGYSVNRYFKPAVYTPMNTAVQYPFKEMMEAAAMKKANTPTLKYDDKEATGAEGFRLASGDFVPLDDQQIASSLQSQLDNQMATLSQAVSNGTLNPQEYQSLMNAASRTYEQTYSPDGILGRLDQNKKRIDKLEQTKAAAKDINVTPWRAMDIDEQLIKYKKGEITSINENIGVDEYVDRIAELNKLLVDVQEEGSAYARPGKEGDPYMHSGSVAEITPEKITSLFYNGFHNSRLMYDLQKEKEYAILTGKLSKEDAEKQYNLQVESALDFVKKSVYKRQTAGIASDAYARGKEEERRLREGDYAFTGLTFNPKYQDLSTTVKNLRAILTNPQLNGSPQHKAALELVNQYGFDIPQGKTLTQGEKITAVANAAENATKQNLEFYLFHNPEIGKISKQWLTNTKGRTAMVLGTGYKGGKTINLENLWQMLGYSSYKDMLNAGTVEGIATTDMYGTGAGSFKMTVYDKRWDKNREIVVSPNEKQGKYFEAAAVLASPSHTMNAHAYYVPGPNGDYTSGYSTDVDPATLPKGQQPPVYYKSNNVITGIGSGNEKSGVNVQVMHLDARTKQYEEAGTTTPAEIFINAMHHYTKNINVPGGQTPQEESSVNANSARPIGQ